METFVPLYISNECDSYCQMCGFKHSNQQLQRRTASLDEIAEQLLIIREYEKISAVCILTGELYSVSRRMTNLHLVCEAINLAIAFGFEKVFFNIGSLSEDEINYIKNTVCDVSKLVLSLFQETYDREAYSKFFGSHPESNAKANFQSRLETVDRWLSAGFSSVDIGILLGFKELGRDVEELIKCAQKYTMSEANVYISTPRIKNGLITDSQYREVIKQIYFSVPSAKLIITTREKISFIETVINYITVISPGSSDICPYRRESFIPNNPKTSQFFIDEKRMRPFDVLSKFNITLPIKYFNVNND